MLYTGDFRREKTDSLRKEDLLFYISCVLNIKIWVWPEKLQIMNLLGFHENFTTQTCLTRVCAIPRYSFSVETLEGLSTLHSTLGVMPSGLPWAMNSAKKNGNFLDSSPSASHLEKQDCSKDFASCSKTHDLGGDSGKIQEFIGLLRPINIKGIVSSSSCYIYPCYYFDHLCGAAQAFWRIHRKLENKEGMDRVGTAETKSQRRRKINQVDFFGISVSRVSLLRLSRGAKIADTEYLT
ncbi:hypothetical protein CDL12_27128 [Handroanthus impetiginosus]|uniref:Uncharacterized protein n=1 Tax=Handroanthus impetiginosus TaxID=429701 RepID=A0A2G9G4Y2_9LAMI|nr:hypothetical protein CDL12_27128 [Handroanthus impetiginosus]